MPVPDYQSLMAPTLAALSDGQPITTVEVRNTVARQLRISEEDRRERVKSGSPVFDSRLHWALTYMSQAGLVTRPKRGVVQITDRGGYVLREHPDRIDNRLLAEFAEFREFKSRARTAVNEPSTASLAVQATLTAGGRSPREMMQAAADETNAAVAAELLIRIREKDPSFLERIVLDVLTAMGYGGAGDSSEQLGRSGDEGLDGVIRQDPLGLDRIYVQAKRYAADRPVGRPDIQGFVGALHGAQADRGVFITTSRFSQDAYAYAEKVSARVILIDGATLTALLVQHNIGAQDHEAFVLKRLDEDFFEEP